MTVSVEWQQDYKFDVINDHNFHFPVDNNNESATCPTDILLSALGSCCSGEVIAGLKQQEVELFGMKTEVSYSLTDTQPRLFKSVNLHFIIKGFGLNDSMVNQVIESAINENCHVALMLKSSMAITYTYHVVQISKELAS
ncbi:OsmC family protein [Vibrio tritonius]|uniref:OsmC family protein n=1 Tax=Vibrio tritonius TaxID=1435069 RepID=A0ABS7YN18_9VIBR|nr:OsmC family protein [Vibrio tritonius]MCA2017081.1 OsmC family protein [Vibrio tritonius]